ncbi:MAG: hypothetical protein ACK559_36585, partial [bacterium]
VKRIAVDTLLELKTSRSEENSSKMFNPEKLPPVWLPNSMEEVFKTIVTIGTEGETHYVGCKGKWTQGEYIPMIKKDEHYEKWQMLEGMASAYSTILALLNDSQHATILRVVGRTARTKNHQAITTSTLETEALALESLVIEAIENNKCVTLWEMEASWEDKDQAPFSRETLTRENQETLQAFDDDESAEAKVLLHQQICRLYYCFGERAGEIKYTI